MKAMIYRLLCGSCAVAAMLTLAWTRPALAQSSKGYNQYELDALKVVHDWDEAWRTKDPQKIAQYMTDDVVIPDPLVQKETGTSREKFITAYNKAMRGIDYYEIVSRYAAGDVNQTVVVEKRRDHVTINGQQRVLNFVGYFRVKNGKIVEWVDVGIGALPPGIAPPANPSN